MPKKDTLDNASEVERVTQLLAAAVRFSNITQREVERKLNLSSGSLSRLFSGGIELKIKHVLDICDVIGFSPSRFFAAAYPQAPGDEGPDSERLQRLLEQLHPDAGATADPSAMQPSVDADLEQTIERLVSKALMRTLAGALAGNGSILEQR